VLTFLNAGTVAGATLAEGSARRLLGTVEALEASNKVSGKKKKKKKKKKSQTFPLLFQGLALGALEAAVLQQADLAVVAADLALEIREAT
jgi:hypothetical protein